MKKKPNVAEDLIAGFTELADALEANEDLSIRFTCYQMQLDLKPRSYTSTMVKQTRKMLSASQQVFARFLGVSGKTVSQWEQGLGNPSPLARRFMDEIRLNPDHYLKRLQDSMVRKSGRTKKLL